VVGLFADTLVPGLLVAAAAVGGLTATPAATTRHHDAPARMKAAGHVAAVAEAARKAAPSVGKLFLVLQRDRRRGHSPLRMPPPRANTCLRKNHS
jgi:hypothetical protein